MSDENPIVGHKTFYDQGPGMPPRHEPIRQDEADIILEQIDAADKARAEAMPTEEDAVRVMSDAFHRLKELGWKESIYAPSDNKTKLVIEVGSSGIHEGRCSPRTSPPTPPLNWWWIDAHGDIWPSKPVLYRERTEQVSSTDEDAKTDAGRNKP